MKRRRNMRARRETHRICEVNGRVGGEERGGGDFIAGIRVRRVERWSLQVLSLGFSVIRRVRIT